MSPRPGRRLAPIALALALAVGAVGCSGEDDETDAAGDGGAGAAGRPAAGGDGEGRSDGEGSDRPFGVGREDFAGVLETATSASDVEIDGDLIVLVYDSGSVEDVTASINCSVAQDMKADEDRVRLSYPDGDLDCEDRDGDS